MAERLLELCGKKHHGFQLCAFEIASRQWHQWHRLVGRGNPAGAAIEYANAVAEQRMDDHRTLRRSFDVDFHGHSREIRFVARVRSFRYKTGEIADALGPAQRLNVLRKNFVGRRGFRVWRNFDLVGIFGRRGVLHDQAWNNLGPLVAVVTGVARH